MRGLQTRPIKDYCIGIFDGPHATPKESDDGPIFLGIKNITDDGRLDLTEIRHVSEEEYPKWTRRVTPRAGDVVLTYEATLHRYALIPKDFHGCLGRRVALVRPDPSKANSKYLLYYFLSFEWRRIVESAVINGATVDRLPLEKLPDFPVRLLQLQDQLKIAEILSAYDDLIENNKKRIGLLEQSGRLLYREWFVRLKYPGHEPEKIVDGLPRGWERRRVSEIVERIPAGKRYEQKTALPKGKVPILDQGGSGLIGYHNEEPSVNATIQSPVIVFANHTCIQRLISYPFSSIQNVLPFVSSPSIPRDIYWLHHATIGLVKLNAYKGHWPEFLTKQVLVPPARLCEMFGQKIKETHSMLFILNQQSMRAAEARDLLLSRLIDGRISV